MRFPKVLLVLITFICMCLLSVCVHAQTYPYRTAATVTSPTTQSYAVAESSRLASGGPRYYRATGGHPTGNMPGARFTGTGYSSSPHNIPTCTPRTAMTLIGDSVTRGADGMYYRVRAWR
jgi:hypothetical protein